MANRVRLDRGLPATVELEPAPGAAAVEAGSIVIRREAIEALKRHPWRGNFRELEIVIERALMLFGDGNEINAEDVRLALAEPT
jgi:DNA-binding NtrC family response regulator